LFRPPRALPTFAEIRHGARLHECQNVDTYDRADQRRDRQPDDTFREIQSRFYIATVTLGHSTINSRIDLSAIYILYLAPSEHLS